MISKEIVTHVQSEKNRNIRVAIVSPVHNRKELTLQCLRSIGRLDTAGLDIHVVIVDDGSTDGTSEAIGEQFPLVEVIAGDGTLWFTEGTNVGIRAALARDPDYLLLINDDQIFDAGALRFMVETAERHERSVVGPLLLLWDTPHKLFQVSPRWETLAGGWRHWYHQTVWTVPASPWEVGIIVGNCVLVPAEAVRECGVMDEKRYPNFGDAEYTPRLKKRGYRLLIDPRARVFCQPNALPGRIRKMGPAKLIDALVFDLKAVHNFRRRYYACVDSAPNRLKGVAAFAVFLARTVLRVNPETSWGEKQAERPIAETFAGSVIRN